MPPFLESIGSIFPILICGFLGGLGSVFGKLAFSGDSLPLQLFLSSCPNFSHYCQYFGIFLRFIAGGLMFATNATGIGYFLRSMETNHTVVVVVLSSSTNFLSTGILGKLIFAEELNKSWYSGSVLILIGMLLISFSQKTDEKKSN